MVGSRFNHFKRSLLLSLQSAVVIGFIRPLKTLQKRQSERLTTPGGTVISTPLKTLLSLKNSSPSSASLINVMKRYQQSPEWDVVKQTIAFLKPFKEATKRLEGDSITLDKVQLVIDSLVDQFTKQMASQRASCGSLTLVFQIKEKRYYLLSRMTRL